MKLFLRLGLILLAFCVVATALLAYVNSVTKPKIDALKIKEAEEARSSLIAGATFEALGFKAGEDSLSYFVAKDATTGEIKGYTFTAAKTGYSSSVKTMAAIGTDYKIIAINVIEQAETPGLGANSTQSSFTNQFKGLAADQVLVDKDGGPIKALTGATITSRAIANSLQEQIALVRKDIESRQLEAQP